MAKTARQIAESPDNARGENYDPNYKYVIVYKWDVPRYEAKGYKVVDDEVVGGINPDLQAPEPMVQMAKPGRKVTNE